MHRKSAPENRRLKIETTNPSSRFDPTHQFSEYSQTVMKTLPLTILQNRQNGQEARIQVQPPGPTILPESTND
jgi:hypothetical protein